MEEFVDVEIDGGVQLELLAVELNRGFIDRNLIRCLPSVGCRAAFWTQLWTVV